MARLTKNRKKLTTELDKGKAYALDEALNMLKSVNEGVFKFNQSVDVCVNLGVDTRKSDQNVRGATDMPNGTGRVVKIAVFAAGNKAEEAEAAGADRVGMDDLMDEMKSGKLDYNIVIATPDAMRIVGKIGPVLGPRGLMPNPKEETVTMNVAAAVRKAKAGQVRYKTDKGGVIHCSIGKLDFAKDALVENFKALIKDLVRAKPSQAKGIYLKKITVTTTMGIGILVDPLSFKY